MEEKNQKLLILAKERVAFRSHFITFAVVNLFLWMLWLLIDNNSEPWPILVTGGWGIAIVSHYFKAYKKRDWIEQEYIKLLEEEDEKAYWEQKLYRHNEK